jgi:hypothetical protein
MGGRDGVARAAGHPPLGDPRTGTTYGRRVLLVVFVVVASALLAKGLQPLTETIDLHVDARGLFGPAGLFLPRAEIVEAYLREPIAGGTLGGRPPVVVPAWPLTVEIITTRGQLNVDARSARSAEAILIALGFPVTTVPAHHIARSPTNRAMKRTALIVMGVVFGAMVALALLQAWRGAP